MINIGLTKKEVTENNKMRYCGARTPTKDVVARLIACFIMLDGLFTSRGKPLCNANYQFREFGNEDDNTNQFHMIFFFPNF